MKKRSIVAASAFAGILLPTALLAQAAQQPPSETRFVTVSSFRVPIGPDRTTVLQYMEKWMVPPARMDQNVLSYRVGFHNWGSNASDMVIIAEYLTWPAINADCAPCTKWLEDSRPKEGTPERKTYDDQLAVFQKYYATHADQIYAADMRLAKK